eukprot:5499276-Ditylum_brightwellii.AAC.1
MPCPTQKVGVLQDAKPQVPQNPAINLTFTMSATGSEVDSKASECDIVNMQSILAMTKRGSSFQTRGSSFQTRGSSFQTRGRSFQTRESSFQTRGRSFQTRESSFQTRERSFQSSIRLPPIEVSATALSEDITTSRTDSLKWTFKLGKSHTYDTLADVPAPASDESSTFVYNADFFVGGEQWYSSGASMELEKSKRCPSSTIKNAKLEKFKTDLPSNPTSEQGVVKNCQSY